MPAFQINTAGAILRGRSMPYAWGEKMGLRIQMSAVPRAPEGDERIGFVQACRARWVDDTGADHAYLTSIRQGEVPSPAGWFIDAGKDGNDRWHPPIFGTLFSPDSSRLDAVKPSGQPGGTGRLGVFRSGTALDAMLDDRPTRTPRGRQVTHAFEVAVVVIAGPRRGQRLGALKWGYTLVRQPDESYENVPMAVVATDTPSADWEGAAHWWNLERGTRAIPKV